MSHTNHPPPDLTLSELADAEDRQEAGEPISEAAAAALTKVKSFRPLARLASSMTSSQRTWQPFAEKLSAMVKHFAEEYRDEFDYVDSQPAWKRKRYEHMTMPEVRRAMRRSAGSKSSRHTRPRTRQRRPSHRARHVLRSSAKSGDSGSGDPEPAAAIGLTRHERFGLVNPPLAVVLDRIAVIG